MNIPSTEGWILATRSVAEGISQTLILRGSTYTHTGYYAHNG